MRKVEIGTDNYTEVYAETEKDRDFKDQWYVNPVYFNTHLELV